MKKIIQYLFFTLTMNIIVMNSVFAINANDIDIGDNYYYCSDGENLNKFLKDYYYKSASWEEYTISEYKNAISILKKVLNNVEKIEVVRINKQEKTIKYRLSDGTPAWAKIENLMDSNILYNLKSMQSSFVSEKCCCRAEMEGMKGFWIPTSVYTKVKNCYGNDIWEDKVEMFDNIYLANYRNGTLCTDTSSSKCE